MKATKLIPLSWPIPAARFGFAEPPVPEGSMPCVIVIVFVGVVTVVEGLTSTVAMMTAVVMIRG